jgi:hypothetical protein
MQSDGSDFLISSMRIPRNGRRKWGMATWPVNIEEHVHCLFEGTHDDPIIKYDRQKIRGKGKKGKYIERCTIYRNNSNDVIMKPGDGKYNFDVRINSYNNRAGIDDMSKYIINKNTQEEDELCCKCNNENATHSLMDCGHDCLCEECSDKLFCTTKMCPIDGCNTKMKQHPIKIRFY